MTVNFEQIKKIVLDENYNNTEMEIQAINGNTTGVGDMLESMGYKRDDAGAVVELLRAGMSESEALLTIKKG